MTTQHRIDHHSAATRLDREAAATRLQASSEDYDNVVRRLLLGFADALNAGAAALRAQDTVISYAEQHTASAPSGSLKQYALGVNDALSDVLTIIRSEMTGQEPVGLVGGSHTAVTDAQLLEAWRGLAQTQHDMSDDLLIAFGRAAISLSRSTPHLKPSAPPETEERAA